MDAIVDPAVENVVLVDPAGRELGIAEKMSVHRGEGRLHRAFSIFIFHSDGRALLQRRSARKYHFPGRWSNACCGHPRPGEIVVEAAVRRLLEELGFETPLQEMASFVYRAVDPQTNLVEHEYDHVFLGVYDCDPCPDPLEVSEWRWSDGESLRTDLARNPERYTPWLALALAALTVSDRAELFANDVGP